VTTYKIESNVPVPPPRRGRPRKHKYPLAELQPGDSFFVPAPADELNKMQNRLATIGRQHVNKKFVTRITRDAPTGVRIWRTS
jgi:hypothetical protein